MLSEAVVLGPILVLTLLRLASAAFKLLRFVKLSSLVDDLYDAAKKKGDFVHISFGGFVGKLAALSVESASIPLTAISITLVALYTIYQIISTESNEVKAKDIAVFTASMSVVVGGELGVPFSISI